VLTLKQGFGRLIRSLEDRGVLVLLDPRITRQRYGQTFLAASRLRMTATITDVEAFSARRRQYQPRVELGASVVRHADGQLRRAAFPRLTFSKMSLAFAVQIEWFGLSVCVFDVVEDGGLQLLNAGEDAAP